jgi:hypothetical protein
MCVDDEVSHPHETSYDGGTEHRCGSFQHPPRDQPGDGSAEKRGVEDQIRIQPRVFGTGEGVDDAGTKGAPMKPEVNQERGNDQDHGTSVNIQPHKPVNTEG